LFLPLREPTPNVFASQWSNLAIIVLRRDEDARVFFAGSAKFFFDMCVSIGLMWPLAWWIEQSLARW